ncbi:predicted molecular weight phosphotyrosine protein phosphatase [Aromatoleum aromaticum EbN1]|uniref:protein-tyrosine-phosphatase n=2 Tax=Aromatoleum aromaticum TaxID=551760 RepID=Q5P2B5_AROAE|nr:molecular weight phosphotyrosine protein phosphatase [Aromatoleum aromaticum]CAI08549.1 predicted molecular weight phosphotyrosine protein phosphatase [Aromatoleum aromaticum EbN1]
MRYLLGQLEGIVGARNRFRSVDPRKVGRLVFVCLGNINRSAFAHAVAAREPVDCISIGLSTTTGAPATETARMVAREFGLSLEHHAATDISDYCPRDDDLLLVMELRHAHRLVSHGIPAARIALLGHWARPIRYHIHDPDTLSEDYYRSCFAILLPAVRNLVNELELGNSPSIRR